DRPDAKVLHRNDGTGRFTDGGTFGQAEWSTRNVTVADLDGDRRPDVIVANRGGPDNRAENHVCLNDGTGRVPDCTVLSGNSATTIAAGDLDGDGDIDLVVPHRDGGQSEVFLNDGRGRFAAPLPLGPPDAATRAVAIGDITGDGRPDLVLGDGSRGGALLYTNAGAGGFTGPEPIGDEADTPYAIAIADLNGDGTLDVILGNRETPGLVLVNRGLQDGFAYDTVRFGDAAGAVYGLAVGDVDGDGCPDVVAARSEALSMLHRNACTR
ncbi:MAG: VCBS repeat-containing protein, partial [Gemmatimonadetes bacterium]|nr:VCBS repeat-containing protein [Gemmatimonadota bacterium]